MRGFLGNPISVVTLSALLYGMTDVLFISVEYVVVFSTLILLVRASRYSPADQSPS
ncbi:hypothetical protein ACFFW8_24530 [Erwinia tracheiphila]